MAGAELNLAKTDYLAYRSFTAGVGAGTELPYGVSLYGQASLTMRDYAAAIPGFDSIRHDDRVDLSIQVSKSDIPELYGFVPSLQYTYTINNSNISIFSYDAHGINLTFTKKF